MLAQDRIGAGQLKGVDSMASQYMLPEAFVEEGGTDGEGEGEGDDG